MVKTPDHRPPPAKKHPFSEKIPKFLAHTPQKCRKFQIIERIQPYQKKYPQFLPPPTTFFTPKIYTHHHLLQAEENLPRKKTKKNRETNTSQNSRALFGVADFGRVFTFKFLPFT